MDMKKVVKDHSLEAVQEPVTLSEGSYRYGRIEDMDRSFDIEFWQKLGTAAIFKAAWEMAKDYHRKQGMTEDEFRLQRSISVFKRFPS